MCWTIVRLYPKTGKCFGIFLGNINQEICEAAGVLNRGIDWQMFWAYKSAIVLGFCFMIKSDVSVNGESTAYNRGIH